MAHFLFPLYQFLSLPPPPVGVMWTAKVLLQFSVSILLCMQIPALMFSLHLPIVHHELPLIAGLKSSECYL